MKRVYWALVILPLLMTACTDDGQSEEMADTVPCVIKYDVTTESAQTRTEVITSTNFATDNRQFRIWSLMTNTEKDGATPVPMTSDFNSNPLYDKLVTYTSDAWIPDATYGIFYWPRSKYRMDCYAIYPSNTTVSFNDTGEKKIVYDSGTQFPGNVDLMYATFSGKRSDGSNETSKTVNLNFHHATAQVMFYGKLSSEYKALGWRIEIESIKLYHVNKTGQFVFSNTVSDLGTVSAMSFTLGNSLPINSFVYSPQMNIGHLSLTETSVETDDEGKDVPLTEALMLLPQAVTPWDPSTENTGTSAPITDGGYLAVKLRAVDGDNNYPLNTSDDGYVTVYSPFGTSSLTDGAWLAGKAYKYTITFGASTSVTAEITPWTSAIINPDKPLYPQN